MKKIVIYHHRTSGRGAEGVHIRGIMGGFLKFGFDLEDISLVKLSQSNDFVIDKDGSKKQYHFFRFIADKIPNIVFKLLELGYSIRSFFYAFYKILKKKAENYTVLIYERYSYFNFGTLLAAKILKVPFFLEVNTSAADYDVREIKLKTIALFIEDFIFSNANMVIVVSHYLKEKIIRKYKIDIQRIVVIPNAVDPGLFALDEKIMSFKRKNKELFDFCQNKVILGFVGVFVKWHGLELLIDILYDIKNDAKVFDDVILLLVGDGPEKQNIIDQIEKKGLQQNVFFAGMVPHNDVKYYMSLFDIAVMPDSNPFGSPMKIFEYMVMQKPIIAPAYSPIKEVLTHSRNSLLFQPKNYKDFYMNLLALLNNKKLRSKLSKYAYEDVISNHTWETNVKKIISQALKNNHIF